MSSETSDKLTEMGLYESSENTYLWNYKKFSTIFAKLLHFQTTCANIP
ncbi:hypothetical protein [Paenibacillus sp. FSL R5-192]|nr:hypothetical protein [Paenibacillus sp. FSL R5-192]